MSQEAENTDQFFEGVGSFALGAPLTLEQIDAQRAEEAEWRREEREDAARATRQQQAALALQLAVQVESGTGVGNPGTILEIATDFLAFLTGEPKTQITN